jgi:hypothetical protein
MLLEPVIDAWRHTFPRDLRFCRQATILHAELRSIAKRYKDKKFVPRGELQAVADNWTDVPYGWMRWPLVRQLTCVAWINVYRTRRGEPAWLFTRAVKAEHDRLEAWLSKEANAKMYIQKDVFEREVMEPFHVAALYHYAFVFFAACACLLGVFLTVCYNVEPLQYISLVYVRRLTRKEIVEWFEKVAVQHCDTELPDAYKEALPPTAFMRPGEDMVNFTVVEMVSPDGSQRVSFIPFPRIAPREYFIRIGSIMKAHQALLMEELNLEQLKVMPPAYFFPLKDDPFPSLGVHHRYYDILEGGDRAPPRLLPGSAPPEWYEKYFYGFVPFPIKTVYRPYGFMGTRADARTGWGRLKDALREKSVTSIAVPWTPMQITNLKCSLYKEGWTVNRVETLPWMVPREMGEHFCRYYGIEETEDHRQRDHAREEAAAAVRAARASDARTMAQKSALENKGNPFAASARSTRRVGPVESDTPPLPAATGTVS